MYVITFYITDKKSRKRRAASEKKYDIVLGFIVIG